MAGSIDEESQCCCNNNNNGVLPFSSTPMPLLKSEKEEKKQLDQAMSLQSFLGLQDLFSQNIWRAAVAELIGTAAFVFCIDVIVISSLESQATMPNLVLACLIAVIVPILVIATFPISGGHVNPLVTFCAFLLGLVSLSKALIYILAQCLGAILGALALKAVVSSAIESKFSLGGCTVTVVAPGPNGPIITGLGTGQALWLEIICGFVFLFASVWMAFDGRQVRALGRVTVCVIIGIVLGVLVFASTTVTAARGYGGAGFNPARCLGPAVVRGGHLWDGHWVFWVGPGVASVAFVLYVKVIPREHFHEIERVSK
ncbi:unnamed protein product [Linum trigynum]|uniref:Uncharacterized protein n=1 Tax=Linum trigynum TaxID=586398 RepID=A0AAV2EGL3_9ROSI